MSAGAASGSASGSSTDDDIQIVDADGRPVRHAGKTRALADGHATQEAEEEETTDDEEYEIEQIVSHSDGRIPGQWSYLVKWLGYPASENTWVAESDMGGAREMILEYWATRRRRALVKNDSEDEKKKKRAVGMSSGAGRRGGSSLSGKEPVGTRRHARARELARVRTKYARLRDWDAVFARIEGAERMPSNKIRIFVRFTNGDRLAFESAVCASRCPHKLIKFYESHLRFKPPPPANSTSPTPTNVNAATEP